MGKAVSLQRCESLNGIGTGEDFRNTIERRLPACKPFSLTQKSKLCGREITTLLHFSWSRRPSLPFCRPLISSVPQGILESYISLPARNTFVWNYRKIMTSHGYIHLRYLIPITQALHILLFLKRLMNKAEN